MMKFNEIIRLPEFERDLKKLSKKYRSLEDDLQNFIDTALYLYHKNSINTGEFYRIPDLKLNTDNPKIYKAKKFACRSLKGTGSKSGIRVIHAYFDDLDRIELVEIYHKSDKELEDRERILKYYKAKC
jgi:mRNA-degrading endonuclease RelE of RelBE toxin-antitoxin system